ncbi:hypothetical protein Poli38472_013507 [Pythium oligandrum]|uniref:FCP1 homology domain-containing protein n=1 Tax=Pythium oligandrum TaxID=41045 RepID=A0A8K1FGS0_PYTOL|nr:hypothetical protein Poli38472_013507 [Pythium oligandrum]|eukprot:TMW58033.1 hypothetical protein Poli38472_013507 [Pythium oligandrum]
MEETAETRRRGKQRRVETQTGYYADPLSPIASTPMKRPRTANTKSTKGKQQSTTKESKQDEPYYSPRKLLNEYDFGEDEENGKSSNSNDEKRTEEESKEGDGEQAVEPISSTEHGDPTEAVMFSPALKVPRPTRSPSASPTVNGKIETTFADVSPPSSAEKSTSHKEEEEEESFTCHEEASAATESEAGTDGTDAVAETEFNPFVFIKALPKYEEVVPDGRFAVLPERTKHTPDVCLVLDLDETLVHCTVEDIENPHLQFPVNFNGVDYTVNVRKRPHMEYFLREVAKHFEVVVFTASHRAYAEKLLNLLDPKRELIKYRLYREDCLNVYGNYLKDLNVLGRQLSKVVLVDNSPHAFGYQVNNGIPIETWYEDEKDDELLNLLPFLESLKNADDVRPIVEKQFQIKKLIDSLPEEIL